MYNPPSNKDLLDAVPSKFKNDNSFCEYTQNAVVKYMDEKGVEIEEVDYDKLDVDVSTLTEENRIFG